MNKLKPALLGGLIVGLLSAIPFIDTCCCLWAIGGGGLACYLYLKSSPTRITPGDGAMLGGLAGVIGAVIYLIIGLPILFLTNRGAAMEEIFTRFNMQLPFTGTVMLLMGGFIRAIILLVLAVIGGLIAVPIFEKRTDAAPPPPPQDFVG